MSQVFGIGLDVPNVPKWQKACEVERAKNQVNILIVDDDSRNLLAFDAALSSLPNVHIETATSGPQALRYLSENQCAAILMDVQIPGMDGIETAKRIRSQQEGSNQRTPIIFITAHNYDAKKIRSAYAVGAVDLLFKPVDIDLLRYKVTVFADLLRAHQELAERAVQQERRTSEQQLRLITDALPAFVSYIDRNGRYRFVNRRYGDWFEKENSDLIGHTVEEVLGPEAAARAEPIIKRAIGGDRARYETSLRRGTNELIHVEVEYVPDIDPGTRQVRGYVVLGHDITERKVAAERLAHALSSEQSARADAEAAVKLRDEFLSIASHELKTPLTPLKLQIQTFARYLAKGSIEALNFKQLKKIATVSEKSITRITMLIENLLDVSRITSGKLVLNLESVDLVELVQDVVERFQSQAQEAQSVLTVQSGGPITGLFDPLRIEQLVSNLLSNSLKYAPGKPVQISIQSENGQAQLSIKDHGVGIAKKDQERIFDRFERVVSPRTVGGLGLGLYIVGQIVKAHGGKISLESQVGVGATFTVILPIRRSLPESLATA